jgi:hypothetical protein
LHLRLKLTGIDNEMQSSKAKIDAKLKTAGQDVQTQLSAVKKRIEQDRAKVEAAQNDMKEWMDELLIGGQWSGPTRQRQAYLGLRQCMRQRGKKLHFLEGH